MTDTTSDILQEGHSKTTVISYNLSLAASLVTTPRCLEAIQASFSYSKPTGTMGPGAAREAQGEERGIRRQRGNGKERSEGERKRKKSNRGFERSPEKALRSYLAASIMLHRTPVCLSALNQIMHPGNCSHIRKKKKNYIQLPSSECLFSLPAAPPSI